MNSFSFSLGEFPLTTLDSESPAPPKKNYIRWLLVQSKFYNHNHNDCSSRFRISLTSHLNNSHRHLLVLMTPTFLFWYISIFAPCSFLKHRSNHIILKTKKQVMWTTIYLQYPSYDVRMADSTEQMSAQCGTMQGNFSWFLLVQQFKEMFNSHFNVVLQKIYVELMSKWINSGHSLRQTVSA